MFPGIATVIGWQSCEHPAPVFEGDVLSFHHTLLQERRPAGHHGRLMALRVEVDAERSYDGSTEIERVLDWVLVTWGG